MINIKPRKPRAVLSSNDPNFEINQYGVFDDTRLMVDDLGIFVDQVNEFGKDLGLNLQGASSSQNTIGTGNKIFTVTQNLGFAIGMILNVASNANVANRMRGAVVSYNKTIGELVISVEFIKGSGTFSDWIISLALDGGAGESNLLYAVTTGTGTAYEASFAQPIAEYNDNQTFKIKFHANCETNATLRLSSLNPPLDIKIQNDAGQYINVFKNDIIAGHVTLGLIINGGTAILIESAINYITDKSNKLINGNFSINQRGVTGTVTLAAGAFSHDRWKAGDAGCTYTFATVENVTTLTITAGTLRQIIEGSNLQTGTHVLSWTGTAQGKIGTGAFGASGIIGLVTGGANLIIEFNIGTLTKAQIQQGSFATEYQNRSIGQELLLSYRYTQPLSISARTTAAGASSYVFTSGNYPVPMRAAPSQLTSIAGLTANVNASQTLGVSATGYRFETTSVAAGDAFVLDRIYLLVAEL